MKPLNWYGRTNMHLKSLLTIAIALAMTVAILLIGLFLTFIYANSIRENTISSTSEIVSQINNNLNYYILDIMNVADYARNVARSTGELKKDDIEEKLSTLKDSRNDLSRITVFDLNGNPIVSTEEINIPPEDICASNWFKQAVEGEGNFFFTGPHIQESSISGESRVITYSSIINFRDEYMTSSKKGIIQIDLNFNAVSEIAENASLPGSGYVFFVTNDGDIVYHPKQNEIDSGLYKEDIKGVQDQVFGVDTSIFEGRERLMIIDPINQTSWRVVGVTYIDEIMESLKTFQVSIIILFPVMILAAFFIAKTIAAYITSPIRQLETIMRQVQSGNFDIVVPMQGTKETQSLSASFSVMVIKIRKLMMDIKKTEEIKRHRELEALQAKINPHFLYNTLDSMIWMAETGDKDGVVKMATSLASLFRISIAKGHDIITIEEELKHVKSYMEIQMMRYKDKFSYEIDIPEALALCPTIKLIIQPIVENSIYHGIKYSFDPCMISIKVREDSGKLLIIVSDNGVGMPQSKADSLLDPKAERTHNPDSNGNGIGLLNIQERIQLTYGSFYGLSIKSEEEVGTTVTITLPKLAPIKPVLIHR